MLHALPARVASAQVVEYHYGRAPIRRRVSEVRPDEARAARDQHARLGKRLPVKALPVWQASEGP